MDTPLHENTGSAWQDHYSRAAYASEAIVHILGKEGFSSAEVRRLFEARGGFMLRMHRSKEGPLADENRLLGAVLSKLALRGNPAPCSLKVERYILQKAQDAGLLVYEESVDNGKIKFSCAPLIKDFDLMLRICCIPELLVDDSEVNFLLHYYETLLEESEPMKRFFDKLISILPDKRLALFVVPAYLLEKDFGKRILKSEDQVHFVIQIPNLKNKTFLRIAVYLGESLNRSDKEDDWIVKRFGQMKRQYWESEVRKLADQISYALQDDILAAAKQLREQPLEKKKAFQELISLPIAEAQLTQVIAGLIYRNERAEIAIGDPQKLNLAVVLEAIRETISALSSLYGIASAIEPCLADDSMEPNLKYYSLPARAAFSCACIIPKPLCLCRGSIQSEAIPRPINRGESNKTVRNGLRFILNNVFRCQEFLEDQEELIEQMLSLSGSIGVLKPSGGMTLAYQLSSILQPGISLVVVPTRPMVIDHENSLSARGFHRGRAIFGPDEEWEQKTKESMEHESDFLFLTVDMLHDRGCRARLENIFSNPINFLVFDEAQLLSEWSHEFQVGYLNLVRWVRDKCALRGSKPSLIALTTINSRLVLLDIMNELDLVNPYCIVESVSYGRKNLRYEIHKVSSKNRMQVLSSKLRATLREYGRKGNHSKIPSGLIIFAHEDDEVMSLASFCESLGQYLNIPVGVCSLKPPKKFLRLGGSKEEWERANRKTQQQFERDELPILVCSPDMAMGLNKEDIRFTLHAGMPAALEEFYRQSGRAGHDGKQSSCIIFFSEDCESSRHEEVSNRMEDSTRNGEPVAQEFPGRVMEKRILSLAILKLLSPTSTHNIGDKVNFEIFISSFPDRLFLTNSYMRVSSEWKQELLEKSLYRLLLIGAIEGYEKGPASFRVNVIISEPSYIYNNYKKYINRYEAEGLACPYLPKENASSYKNAVLKCGCRLVEYGYHRFKTKKADDMAKMLEAAEAGLSSIGKFQDYLQESMEQSVIAARLAAAASESWWRVLEEIKGVDDLLGLFLACRKVLRLQPDDPVIHMITGFCALAFPETGQEHSELVKGFLSLKYSTTTAYRLDVARRIVSYGELLMPSKRDLILERIWQVDPSLEISRLCYERSRFSSEISYLSLFKLVNGLLETFKAEVSNNE